MRADLAALTPDTLATLTNRGLVKRAARDVEAGAGPTVSEVADGTVHGDLSDGTRTAIPLAGLAAATCTCGAAGTCRHVIALVLAYQSSSASSPAVETGWSPGEFTDDLLVAHLGERVVAAARQAFRRGFAARVRRGTAGEPPRVELPSCTVRFLVPHELGYASSDARPETAAESVALAVWACRLADERSPDAPEVHLEVGGAALGGDIPSLAAAADLAGDVLLGGASNLGPGLAAAFATARRDLDGADLRWPLLALDDLAAQLDAYASRTARYAPERLAELVTELHARHRAAGHGGTTPRSRVLGTEEAAETRLRQVRLSSVGCRVEASADERTAEVYLVDAGSGTVLVLRHRWPVTDEGPTGAELAERRVAGSTLGALAAGNIVTESAVRLASRALRLAGNRVARTTISPSSGAWDQLPDTVLVRSLDALAAELDRWPPRVIRPRVAAEAVRVVPVEDVLDIGYQPGDQRLEAIIAAGGTARVSATYRSVSPAALDTLHAGLSGALGTPRFLSGTVHRTRGGIVIDPIAVVAGDAIHVLDLAPPSPGTPLAYGSTASEAPLPAAVGAALALLAQVSHRGARHLPTSFSDQLRAMADRLAPLGLRRAGEDLRGLAGLLGPNPSQAFVTAWVNAHLRLLVTAERL